MEIVNIPASRDYNTINVEEKIKKKKISHTGNRTPASSVRARNPNH